MAFIIYPLSSGVVPSGAVRCLLSIYLSNITIYRISLSYLYLILLSISPVLSYLPPPEFSKH
ncbi:hypothetical protein BD779DRAFT_1577558 [Infundibulicybe gibba]|nr:hypothetical protein BD779DRAFT_1577558 [Infundibulicybe gibba]